LPRPKTLIFFIAAFFLIGCASTRRENSRFPFRLTKDLPADGILQWDEIGAYPLARAEQIARAREEAVSRLAEPDIDPYKGEDNVPVICRKENLPAAIHSKSASGFITALALYSSKDLVLGLCSDPDHLKKTQYLLLYSHSTGRLYSARYFYTGPWLTGPIYESPAGE
jgi:hypothetical protein